MFSGRGHNASYIGHLKPQAFEVQTLFGPLGPLGLCGMPKLFFGRKIDLFHRGHMGPARSQQGPTKREQGHNWGLQVVNIRISQKSKKIMFFSGSLRAHFGLTFFGPLGLP